LEILNNNNNINNVNINNNINNITFNTNNTNTNNILPSLVTDNSKSENNNNTDSDRSSDKPVPPRQTLTEEEETSQEDEGPDYCVQCGNEVLNKDNYYYLHRCPDKCVLHEECANYLIFVHGRETGNKNCFECPVCEDTKKKNIKYYPKDMRLKKRRI